MGPDPPEEGIQMSFIQIIETRDLDVIQERT